MSGLKLFLLGPPRFERDGVALDLQYRKNIALIAYLALTGGSHSREMLTALLWPEAEPGRARADLRRNLSLLKKALAGEWLVVERETIELDSGAGLWLDVDEFHHLLAGCATHGHPTVEVCPECIPLLEEAAALYGGDFMAGFTLADSAEFDEWQLFQAEELRRELASALERLVRTHSGQGEYEQAISHARRWLALDSLHEPAHRWLMRLYAWSGQRAAALRQYEQCEQALRQELGMSPEEETTRLYQAIKQNQESPPSPSLSKAPRKHNLPLQLTPFIGRATQLAQVGERLRDADCRLLTLVGPGGSGKTRLALETGTEQLEHFEHGVYFVSLAPLQSVETIAPTVARAIGVSFGNGGDPRQRLLDYLRQKQMLLILDNFEHLPEGAGLASDILGAAPRVKVLATSRVRLNVEGEHLFYVEGLDCPAWETPADVADYGAVKLFVHSARRVRPGLAFHPDDLRYVVRICRLVQGMPLAILLAAGWARLLTPAEIAAEIEKGLDFLETDLRDAPERQRSVRATFDYSWNLLTQQEQQVFQALAVFCGGCTREAAEQVAGAGLRDLMGLVNKSLLYRAPTGRYEMHELLQRYAAEKLDAVPDTGERVRDRHSAYYTAALSRWSADIKGPRQKVAYAEARTELENVRAAWTWAIDHASTERMAQAVEGMCWSLGFFFSPQEEKAICQTAAEALSRLASPSPEVSAWRLRVLARILAGQSYFAGISGNRPDALRLYQQALALLGGPELAGQDTRLERAIALLFGTLWVLSPRDAVLQAFKESVALFRAVGEPWWAALAQAYLGRLAVDWGSYSEGKRLLEESLAIQRSLGDELAIGYTLRWLSTTDWVHGDLDESERLARENLAISQDLGSPFSIAAAFCSLGEALLLQGRFAEAHDLLDQGRAIFADLGADYDMHSAYGSLGMAEAHLGQYEVAHTRGQATLEHQRLTHDQWWVGFSACILSLVALAGQDYAASQRLLQEAQSIFRAIDVKDSLAWALALVGYAARGLGRPDRARQHLAEALQVAMDHGFFVARLYALPAVALLLADAGQLERAVELYALASRYGFVANSRWFEDVAGRHIAAAAVGLPAEAVAAAQERSSARDMDATLNELLAELLSSTVNERATYEKQKGVRYAESD